MSTPTQLAIGTNSLLGDSSHCLTKSTSLDEQLRLSAEIWQRAITEHPPYAVVAMVSGGDDSITALSVALALGIKIDFIGHGITRTGTIKTTQFVQTTANNLGIPMIVADAGDAYVNYLAEWGFFGRGRKAHTYAYHLLKAGPFRKMISHNIRHRKRGRNVLLINGARLSESENRRKNLDKPIDFDTSTKSNVWVSLIHHWSSGDCRQWLHNEKVQRNPVSVAVGRSGECMCGTMQCEESYQELKAFDPEWGKRMDALRIQTTQQHGWDWGQDIPKWKPQVNAGQMFLFQPMCRSCIAAQPMTEVMP